MVKIQCRKISNECHLQVLPTTVATVNLSLWVQITRFLKRARFVFLWNKFFVHLTFFLSRVVSGRRTTLPNIKGSVLKTGGELWNESLKLSLASS